jgi:transglutaminase-like putative cysteine protease
VIYDKRLETFAKKPEAYQRAMIQNRWSDNIPESATRIEYQIRREWFAERGLKTVESVLNNLGGIIAFLTKCEDRPFFFLTDRVPDRECRHQNRAQPHESWRRAVAIMQEQAGKPMQEIRRLDRSMMKSSRAIRVAIGHVQTAAAQLELNIGGCDDLVWVFSELLRRTGITDEEVSQQWEAKARRAGTYGRVTGFPFGGNQAI